MDKMVTSQFCNVGNKSKSSVEDKTNWLYQEFSINFKKNFRYFQGCTKQFKGKDSVLTNENQAIFENYKKKKNIFVAKHDEGICATEMPLIFAWIHTKNH